MRETLSEDESASASGRRRGKEKGTSTDGACTKGCPEQRRSNVIPWNGWNRGIKRNPRGSWLHVETSGRSFGFGDVGCENRTVAGC